jgi:hypothetical protein
MMGEKDADSGKIKESRATYRVLQKPAVQRPLPEVLKDIDEFRKRHAADGADGKDVVTLVREERER